MAKEYSHEIAAQIEAYLKSREWKYRFIEEDGVFTFGLNIGTKLKNLDYLIRVKIDDYSVYAISPIGADEDEPETLARMAEFTCRANYGLRNGCFELDFRDGELRYKSYVDGEDLTLSEAVIENSIRCPAAMFRRYAPAILAAALTDQDVAEAVEACEQ